jgi:solute carrier family 25 (mitochondrial folate transporter), member 32
MDGLFGLAANGLSTFLTHPIDVVKTNYQLNQIRTNNNNKTDTRSIIRNIWKTRGMRGFYAGVSPNLCTYPIFWSVYFGTNQMMGDIRFVDNKYGDKFIKSYTAALIGSGLTNPLFVLKTRMQNSEGRSRSVYETLRSTNRLGYRTYFRGLGSTYLTNTKLAIQFPMYDMIKDRTDSVIASSLAAKTISSSIMYPLDLIRVNQRNSDREISIREIARTIYARNGIRGLYRGVFLYNAVTTPNFVVMMIGYEMLKKFFTP